MLGCTATENVMYGIMLNPKNGASRYSQQLLTYKKVMSDKCQQSCKSSKLANSNVEMLPKYFYICIMTNSPVLDY